MSTLTIDDRAVQLIAPGAGYTELRWRDTDGTDHGTRFALEGRHLFLVWLSHDAPPDSRAPLIAGLTAIPTVTDLAALASSAPARSKLSAWMKSIDKAVRGALTYKPPSWVFRIARHLPDGSIDFTEREGVVMAPIADTGMIYLGELDCDPEKPVSIDVRHTVPGLTIAIDAKNLHAPRIWDLEGVR